MHDGHLPPPRTRPPKITSTDICTPYLPELKQTGTCLGAGEGVGEEYHLSLTIINYTSLNSRSAA